METKKIGMIILKVMSFVLTFVAAIAITLLISLKMLCSDAFPHVQQTFVTTILETGQLKFLASWFLSPEEIQKIVDDPEIDDYDDIEDPPPYDMNAPIIEIKDEDYAFWYADFAEKTENYIGKRPK